MLDIQIVSCDRCGVPCKVAYTANEDARLLMHSTAPAGWCADCAATDFMKNRSPLARMMEMNPIGKAMLLDPRVQAQFAVLMKTGNTDAKPEELNWQRIHGNWELPFGKPKRKRKSA